MTANPSKTKTLLASLATLALFVAPILADEMSQSSWILRANPSSDQLPIPVVTAVAIQPGGRLLATSGDDHYVRIWDLSTGRLVTKLAGHSDWVYSATFSPDGQRLVTAGGDGKILVWHSHGRPNGNTWKQTQFARQEAAIARVEFSPDGEKLAVAGFNSKLTIYDVPRRQQLLTIGCPCHDMRAVAVSPRGDLLACGGRNGHIRISSLESGETLRDIDAHRMRIRAIVFTADQTQILSAGEDRTVRVWNVIDGQPAPRRLHHPCKVLAMTLCGPERLATAGSDNLIRIWDLHSGRKIVDLVGHTGSVAALDFDQQTLVSGSYDTTARVWRLDRIEKVASRITD